MKNAVHMREAAYRLHKVARYVTRYIISSSSTNWQVYCIKHFWDLKLSFDCVNYGPNLDNNELLQQITTSRQY